MHLPPKLWSLLLLLPLLQPLHGFPTINQPNPQYNNYGQGREKLIFHPPQIEETIEEVQKILAEDPSLPRLTRGEIEELYEKVTREEYEKSLEAGDMGRADSMRALMLVLPYNTDNNTEENLQELYTRPPITKVIEAYTPPNPIKFITPDPNFVPKQETVAVGNLAATTYKPSSPIRPAEPNPTTYHPSPRKRYQFKSSQADSEVQLRPVTNLPLVYEYGAAADLELNQTPKPVQRFSSHYNAKNAEFLKTAPQKRFKATVKPVADVLEGLGIVSQNRRRYPVEDYYTAESAPRPVVSNYAPQNLGPKIRPDAYSSFKPLNIGEEIRIRPEVEGYLTRFGIVGGRRRKELKKAGSPDEQAVEGSEIATAKIPASTTKHKKSTAAQSGGSELEKLLINLQELERLNVNPKVLKSKTAKVAATTKKPKTSTTTTTSTSTTTTSTTKRPTTAQALITNGSPMLIEAKKPRRRVDPNLDINFGATGNQQTQQGSADQLQKLLENLQELEKLRINPERVLKTVTAATLTQRAAAQLDSTVKLAGLTNRFNEPSQLPQPQLQHQVTKKTGPQNDVDQLQRILKELEVLEQANAKARTTTTTKQPAVRNNNLRANIAPNDFDQLRKLLSDDGALEKLYEQARGKQVKAKPSTTTTTTTTTTTLKPGPSLKELEELQRYFAELDRVRTTTTLRTTSTIKTTTTTTTTTPKPTTTTTPYTTSSPQRPSITTQDLAQRITANLGTKSRKQIAESEQLQELINRVQQLERLNSKPPPTTATDSPQFLVTGFTSRNINQPPAASANDYRIPSNDFAHLQQLYRQVHEAEQSVLGGIEISTAATASKSLQQSSKRTQEFAQRIIDITNDTGSGSSLLEVDPTEFVQLQKLLSKVQELERVKITADGSVQRVTQSLGNHKPQASVTVAPNLVTAASIRTQSVQNTFGAQIAQPEPMHSYQQVDELLLKEPYEQNIKSATPDVEGKPASTTLHPSSLEDFRVFRLSTPAAPKKSVTDAEYAQYQKFVTRLEDNERNSYRHMQPPMIEKTVTKEPPKFISTRKSQDSTTNQSLQAQQYADLEELQKLLNNAQELKKLGISLPKELSQQIEQKLSSTRSADASAHFKRIQIATPKSTSLASAEHLDPPEVEEYLTKFGILDKEGIKNFSNEIRDSSAPTPIYADFSEELQLPLEKTAVFSLTTARSATTKESKPTTTGSPFEVPIFSATKIIEAAIKRAANKIGVSTEKAHGFRRRSDEDVDVLEVAAEDADDLMGEFSEMNYQLATPEINRRLDANVDVEEDADASVGVKSADDFTKDLGELQRLISNLQELKKLNLTASPDVLRQADAKYLESLKNPTSLVSADNEEAIKKRRQSATPTAATLSGVNLVPTAATASPTRFNLDLSLDESDVDASDSTSTSTSTSTEASTTTSTTEESRNGSLADLEDSFGPNPITESPLPPKKKNGFYFLADWNSFLEVGEDKEKVVVRFSPKIGDPRLFLPVTVP